MKKFVFTASILSLSCVVFAQDGEFHIDREYKIDKAGLVEITSTDAKVFVTGSTRNTAHVKIDRKVTAKGWTFGEENFHVDIDEEDGNLVIDEKQRGPQGGVVGFYHEDYRIELEVPRGVSLRVRGDDGDYYIKNVNGSIVLNLDDADAELVGCEGNNFEFRLDDGDIRMDQGRGKLELTADDADIEIRNASFESIRADVDDGDLIIETSLAEKGEYFISSQDGTIVMSITGGGGEFDIRHDDANVSTEGDFKVLEKSERETRVTLANGSAKVSVRADDARVRLRAK